ARSWLRALFARTPHTVRKAPARFLPAVEALEDRRVPALALSGPAIKPAAAPVVKAAAVVAPAPKLVSVRSLTNQQVQLRFDARPGQGSANRVNYVIDGLTVTKAVLQVDLKGVLLTTSPQDDGDYTVVVSNVKARNGVAMPQITGNFPGTPPPSLVGV